MARKKKKKIALSKKQCIFITLLVVIIGLFLIVINRTILQEPKYEIYFHKSRAEIYIGDQINFGYTVTNSTGNDKIMWTTTNSNVATVDANGKVTGVSFGDVIITAELSNGESTSLKLRVNSYPVRLVVNTDILPMKGWYNKEVNVTFDALNIKEIKYCITDIDECYPTLKYNNKITLKNGIWYLYITYVDRNNKTVSHREEFKVDLISPKCNITRIGKLYENESTIEVICEDDKSGIEKYEWYRDDKKVLSLEERLLHTNQIYENGKHKYSVKVYDIAGNFTTYSIDN